MLLENTEQISENHSKDPKALEVSPLGAILLTNSKPKEIRDAIWEKEANADMLANKSDFRFPFKETSLICPFCSGELDATPEADPTGKKKPWDLSVTDLRHSDKESQERCKLGELRKDKNGRIVEKLLLCHFIAQAARLGSSEESLHEAASVPKIQSFWEEEKAKKWNDLADPEESLLPKEDMDKIKNSGIEKVDPISKNPLTLRPIQGKKIPQHIVFGQMQRLIPFDDLQEKGSSWRQTLSYFPRWSKTNPEDPNAPEVTGWVICHTPNGVKTLCGYILDPELEKEQEDFSSFPQSYPVPIFRLYGPESLFENANPGPVAYLEADLISGPAQEVLEWQAAATVETLKKSEKLKRKAKIKDEISRLPRERIWEGFNKVSPQPIEPEKDRFGEPPQFLEGYRIGGDVKKWWLPGIGNPHAKVWVIGLYPSNEEVKRKSGPKILSGASGEELFSLVRECGLDPSKDVFFENLVKRYMPPKSKLGAEVKMEQTWLLAKQIAHFKPERVICLGAEVFKELSSNKSFGDLRGTWITGPYPKHPQVNPSTGEKDVPWEGRIAGTFHPAGVLRPEGRHNLELFRHDFKELLLDVEKEDVNPQIAEYRTLEEVRDWVDNEIENLDGLDAQGQKRLYSVDTEGFSLDFAQDELVCLQLSRIDGELDETTQKFDPITCPKQCEVFLFRENQDPEALEAASFELGTDFQLSLSGLSGMAGNLGSESPNATQDLVANSGSNSNASGETSSIKKKPPVIELANSYEEKRNIIANHGKRKKGRDLIIFTPYARVNHLGNQENEVGELLKKVFSHKNCAGFVITNANYDRVRIENFLGIDLSLPREHGGLAYPLDTMLSEHVLDENGDLGLKACLNKHFNWPRQDIALDQYAEEYSFDRIQKLISEKSRQSPWSLYPWRVLKPYAAKDAYGTAALLVKQLAEIDIQVLKHQRDRIVSGNPNTLEKAFHISCQAISGTYEMHKMGMPVGEKGMKILRELTAFYKAHEEQMVASYKDTVFKLTGLRDANPASPENLAYVLFNENSPLRRQGIEPWKESGRNGRLWHDIPKEERPNCTPSTDAESLEIIASNCPDPELQKFLLKLSDTKTILTIRSSFLADPESGKGLTGRINPRTLCMHTTYTPTLDTNRCRSVPNLSTFPKEEVEMVRKILGEAPPHKIREIIQAPEGAYLLNRDWTTAEVLGLGYLSQDQNMLRIISKMNAGMDFHCKLALKTYGKIQELFSMLAEPNRKAPPIDWIKSNFPEKTQKDILELWKNHWKENPQGARMSEEAIHKHIKKIFKQERTNIKPVTFGVPYGREAPAIMKALNREYYVNDVRDSQGELIKVSLGEAQAMIDSYKSEFPSAWQFLVNQAANAKEKGVLRDHWGYLRHFPIGMSEGDLTRKAYNYQVQHIVAVLMNQAMFDWVERRKKHNLKSYAYATLYDNIGWVVYEEELQKVWDLSMEVMTQDRPVGPAIGELPILNTWHIPTEGDISTAWDGPSIDPESLNIELHNEKNLTGLESKF